ncbi:MAG TPA: ABC transporter substrate-binding protein, partial [Acidocella sp.]|nr:ABC transporter substrate-binding protein [Acidocella sp.]
MKRRILIALLAVALGGATAARADTPEAAPVTALNSGLLAVMKAGSGGANFATREASLTPVVQQSYDLQTVTQNSVGFLWSTLPAAQQQKLVELIGQFTTASYASQFNSYGGESFSVLPTEKPLG